VTARSRAVRHLGTPAATNYPYFTNRTAHNTIFSPPSNCNPDITRGLHTLRRHAHKLCLDPVATPANPAHAAPVLRTLISCALHWYHHRHTLHHRITDRPLLPPATGTSAYRAGHLLNHPPTTERRTTRNRRRNTCTSPGLHGGKHIDRMRIDKVCTSWPPLTNAKRHTRRHPASVEKTPYALYEPSLASTMTLRATLLTASTLPPGAICGCALTD
jgi:hypothetical protein